jgi:hypothetical protein
MRNPLSIYSIWRGDRNPELRGTTGRIFEREVLGECLIRSHGYVKFRPALEAVFRNQPGSTFEPMGEAANFRDAVAAKMREMGFDSSRLQLYTAVGSALDVFHKIDGFFVFEGTIVTLDTTTNPHKDCAPRARVLVTAEDAIIGYQQSAAEIAGWFNHAKACGQKGVI